MSKPLVSDRLWAIIAPLLPSERPKPKGGRPRVADRAALTGILFVLKSGIRLRDVAPGDGLRQWHDLVAAPARLAASWSLDWPPSCALTAVAGCWADRLGAGIPRQRKCASSGGRNDWQGPNESRQLGTKRHLVVDRQGLPLAVTISGSNRHDSTMLEQTVDAIPSLRLP